MTVTSVANLFKDRGIVRSALIYKAYVVFVHKGRGVQAGSYLFDQPQSALRVAYRTAYGVSDLQKIRITIFEGTNSKEIGAILERSIPGFDAAGFVALAKKSEGYLFPETYFFNPDVEPKEVIDSMREQFDEKIASIADAFATSTRTLSEIIAMASILEEEANNTADRRLISGILWNRINADMALQVDAPFYYLLGKGSSQLTRSDLATASSYNTYLNKGLTPAPISNPGLDAIMAAINPIKTSYYYYLADRKGVTHYAKDHDGHVANKERYLQ